MRKVALVTSLLAAVLLCVTYAQSAGWLTIHGDRLCVTEGAIEKTARDRLSVNVPKMRAYVNEWTAQSAEMRFTYFGGTSKESALGSGAIRRQFGLKLHAQDPCNLVYAMWRAATKTSSCGKRLPCRVCKRDSLTPSALK
jgi:hypothetical protein